MSKANQTGQEQAKSRCIVKMIYCGVTNQLSEYGYTMLVQACLGIMSQKISIFGPVVLVKCEERLTQPCCLVAHQLKMMSGRGLERATSRLESFFFFEVCH